MPYNNSNVVKKRRHAMEVTRTHYEPGRHDRCYRWIWNRYIRDQFHIEYDTYLRWLRFVRDLEEKEKQLKLF